MEPRLAITPQNNDAFLREVDEELRRDSAVQFWNRYGRLLIGAVVAGLVAFGGYLLWQNWREQQAGAIGTKLTKVYEQLGKGDVKGATAPLAEIAATSNEGYAVSARFIQADIALQKNDLKGAAKIFGAIAADGGVSPAFRNLALIRQTNAELDTLAPQAVIDRLKSLAVKDSPWLGSAGELVAVAHLQAGHKAAAAKIYGLMAADEAIPETLRSRAVQMAGTLGIDAIKDNGDTQR